MLSENSRNARVIDLDVDVRHLPGESMLPRPRSVERDVDEPPDVRGFFNAGV